MTYSLPVGTQVTSVTRSNNVVIVGIRTPADAGQGCNQCHGLGSPAVGVVLPRRNKNSDPEMIRVCLPCLGKGVENATGWRVMNAWSQWLSGSQISAQIASQKLAITAPSKEAQ